MVPLDKLNTAFAAAIANIPGPEAIGYVEAREALRTLQKQEPSPDILTETLEVSGKCGPTAVTVVRSRSLAGKPLPMVYYLHGGGWVTGW